MPEKKTAVVILNWNGKDFLSRFLPGIIAYSGRADIVVADNASTDGSVEMVRAAFPSVCIVQNETNGGFAKGYNDALRKIKADYYVLLNSDVEVTPGWLDPMLRLMESEPGIVACQPKILDFKERSRFEYAGAAGGFIDKFGYPFCRGRIFHSFEQDQHQYDDSREIFWATGACLLIRADAYHAQQGLDEDFFAHMEEIDLCWRLKNQGYKIMYCASSSVYHMGGGTLSRLSPRKTYLNFRNNLILLCKNHAPEHFTIKLMIRMHLDGIAGLKFLASGDISHFFAVIRAHCSFYYTLPKTMRKRRALKKQTCVYATTAIYRKSIVFDYFLRGKKKFSALNERLFY
ncbi:MAG: glycosyltransferase family 2 protein [Bacteroidia bacterium]